MEARGDWRWREIPVYPRSRGQALCGQLYNYGWWSARLERRTASLPWGEPRDPEMLQTISKGPTDFRPLTLGTTAITSFPTSPVGRGAQELWAGENPMSRFSLHKARTLLSLSILPAIFGSVLFVWCSALSCLPALPLYHPSQHFGFLVTWHFCDMISSNLSFYSLLVDYFSHCHSIYPEMKAFR